MANKIIYNMKECIGAGECETISKHFWKLDNDGKAKLNGAKYNEATKMYELEITDAEFDVQKKIEKSCPGDCIKVIKT